MRVVQRRLESSERLRFGVVADTHGKPHPDAVRWLRERAPDAILHAGDVGALSVLDALGDVAEVIAVRGNIDGKVLPDFVRLDLAVGGRSLGLLLTHIAIFGGARGVKLRSEVHRAAIDADASVVVCGHSHVPFIGTDRGLAVFNPGSIGPRRFRLPIAFGMLEVRPEGIDLVHVDCETGKPLRL